MFNAFDKKTYVFEEENDNKQPFDKRIKQIENIRKNRLFQLEKQQQQAQTALNQSSSKLNHTKHEIIEQTLYYSLLAPIIEQKFLFLDANVQGLNTWVDKIKQINQNIKQIYADYQLSINDWNAQKQQLEQAKQDCKAMLIKTEKLALLETIYNENGGI